MTVRVLDTKTFQFQIEIGPFQINGIIVSGEHQST